METKIVIASMITLFMILIVTAYMIAPIISAGATTDCAEAVNGHYVSSKFYNSVVHATDSPILNNQEATDAYIHGIQSNDFNGKNVTQIVVTIARYVDVSQPTGNIVIGVFDNNNPTYTIRQSFANINVNTLTEYPTFQNYKANFTSGYIMQAGDIIGIEVNAGAVGERSGLVDRVDDTIVDLSVFVLNDNTEYNHGGFAGNGNLFGSVSESIFIEDFTQYEIDRANTIESCNSIYHLAIGIILVLCIVILALTVIKKNE